MLNQLRTLCTREDQARRDLSVCRLGNHSWSGLVNALREWGIDLLQNLCRTRGIGANDDAVRIEKIRDRCALAQELRIGNYIEVRCSGACQLHHAANQLIGVDRYGTLFDNDFVSV